MMHAPPQAKHTLRLPPIQLIMKFPQGAEPQEVGPPPTFYLSVGVPAHATAGHVLDRVRESLAFGEATRVVRERFQIPLTDTLSPITLVHAGRDLANLPQDQPLPEQCLQADQWHAIWHVPQPVKNPGRWPDHCVSVAVDVVQLLPQERDGSQPMRSLLPQQGPVRLSLRLPEPEEGQYTEGAFYTALKTAIEEAQDTLHMHPWDVLPPTMKLFVGHHQISPTSVRYLQSEALARRSCHARVFFEQPVRALSQRVYVSLSPNSSQAVLAGLEGPHHDSYLPRTLLKSLGKSDTRNKKAAAPSPKK